MNRIRHKTLITAMGIRRAKKQALDDIAKLEGTGVYNHPGNPCWNDGIYAESLKRKYGVDSIAAIKKWAKS